MISTVNLPSEISTPVTANENKRSVDYHKKTAACLVTAARHYLAAAKHEEEGDNKKAYESTIQAEGILLLALTFKDKK